MTLSDLAGASAPDGGGTRDGRLLFARYALMPNRLGYCGGPEIEALLDYCVADEADPGLDGLIGQFEAAYPYLCFIARSTGVANPFDPRVVQAYWLGGSLLQNVEARDFYAYVDEQLGRRIPDRLRPLVLGKVPEGARPQHSFHVLDVSTRTGALPEQIAALDSCRIASGTVVAVDGDGVVVRSRPLELREGRLALGRPQLREARRGVEGKSYLASLAPGSVVTLHWDWVCDEIAPVQAARLEAETLHHIELANRTL